MDVIRGPLYSLNYRILSITGQWPYLSKKEKWIRGTLTTFLVQTLIVPMWLGLFKALGNITLSVECISPLVIINGGFIMFVNFMIMCEELKALLEKIEKDWLTWSTEPEIEILKKYAEKGKQFRITYAVTVFGVLGCFLAFPGFPVFLDWIKPLNESRPRTPVYFTNYGVDTEEYYTLIFWHSYFFSFFVVVLLVNADMIFMACVQHACGLLAGIGSKLTNLINDKHYSQHRENNFQNNVNKNIIFCIKQHKELIIFLRNLHKCFSFVFLVTVTVNMLIISVTGVQTVMNLNSPTTALRFGTSTIGQMIHLFCLTLPCQKLIDHSISISDAAYKSNWYLLPVQSRKFLLMIMRRSLEPFEFTVGKIYTYSMQNFAMVIKTSISYFTVLTSVQ